MSNMIVFLGTCLSRQFLPHELQGEPAVLVTTSNIACDRMCAVALTTFASVAAEIKHWLSTHQVLLALLLSVGCCSWSAVWPAIGPNPCFSRLAGARELCRLHTLERLVKKRLIEIDGAQHNGKIWPAPARR